ncbi:MAG: RNA polymerase sigma factor [Bacteroidales bacterium]
MMVILLSSQRLNDADKTLIRKYRESGDKAVIAELFNRYSGFVLAICMKYMRDKAPAEEMTVEIFESLFEKLKKHKVDYFKTWLYSVARNHCLENLRKSGTRHRHETGYQMEERLFMESEEDAHLSTGNEDEHMVKALKTAVEELSNEQKQCVSLFYFQERSYADIVRITGYPLKKVKSYLQNGKRNLKIKMEALYESEQEK